MLVSSKTLKSAHFSKKNATKLQQVLISLVIRQKTSATTKCSGIFGDAAIPHKQSRVGMIQRLDLWLEHWSWQVRYWLDSGLLAKECRTASKCPCVSPIQKAWQNSLKSSYDYLITIDAKIQNASKYSSFNCLNGPLWQTTYPTTDLAASILGRYGREVSVMPPNVAERVAKRGHPRPFERRTCGMDRPLDLMTSSCGQLPQRQAFLVQDCLLWFQVREWLSTWSPSSN